MKRTIIFTLLILLVASIGGIIGAVVTFRYLDPIVPYTSIESRQNNLLTGYVDSSYRVPRELNFLAPAHDVVASVVHIRASFGSGSFSMNPLELSFRPEEHSSGSGVIISDDGYIVTNNHVIEDATNIEIVLENNQRFFAKVIGTDPSTDLALLKIKSKNLPFLKYGNSDEVKLGEWVLAVGNPFNLNSTVTAGIVSAKARNIGILQEKNNLQVESFIQTDAAVNVGNSGGALVNLKGELIGINSAIATATGSYSGYSFAIPVSLVKKVMDDLLEFGQVQRGLLGVQILSMDANLAEQLKLDVNEGVLVTRVNRGSAAEESDMHTGDVITAINKQPVASVSELQEWVARNRPGKEIQVTFLRNGESRTVKATLKNNEGNESMTQPEIVYEFSGVTVEDITLQDLAKLNLDGGVRLKTVTEGKWKEAGIQEGFVLAYLDRVPVDDVRDLNRMLEYKHGGILLEGYYKGEKKTYGLDW
ncbi:MAG TPA: trypsin-like peptidase domain-containing protein [Cyclobacteriaceae bacterium]|nr:trypsin-like peptidase domain-containing protein [Cyclobacteriaceae bacterium]